MRLFFLAADYIPAWKAVHAAILNETDQKLIDLQRNESLKHFFSGRGDIIASRVSCIRLYIYITLTYFLVRSYSNEQNESFQPLKATLDSSQSPVATSVILQSPHPPTSHPFKQPGQIPASPTYRYISSAQRFASSFSSLLDTEALERIRYQLQHGVNPFLNISASSPDPSSSQAEQQPPTSSNTSFSSTSSQADTASRSTDTTNSSASTLPSASSSSASILRPSSTLTTAGNYQQHDASSRPPMPLGSPSHSLDPGSAQARQLFFQQTSAESFEESLMAGGYGRYVGLDGYQANTFLTYFTENNRVGPAR